MAFDRMRESDMTLPIAAGVAGAIAAAWGVKSFFEWIDMFDHEQTQWALSLLGGALGATAAGTYLWPRGDEDQREDRNKTARILGVGSAGLLAASLGFYAARDDGGETDASTNDVVPTTTVFVGEDFDLTPLPENVGDCELVFPLDPSDVNGVYKFQASVALSPYGQTSTGPIKIDGDWGGQTTEAENAVKASVGKTPEDHLSNEDCRARLPQLADGVAESPAYTPVP